MKRDNKQHSKIISNIQPCSSKHHAAALKDTLTASCSFCPTSSHMLLLLVFRVGCVVRSCHTVSSNQISFKALNNIPIPTTPSRTVLLQRPQTTGKGFNDLCFNYFHYYVLWQLLIITPVFTSEIRDVKHFISCITLQIASPFIHLTENKNKNRSVSLRTLRTVQLLHFQLQNIYILVLLYIG